MTWKAMRPDEVCDATNFLTDRFWPPARRLDVPFDPVLAETADPVAALPHLRRRTRDALGAWTGGIDAWLRGVPSA